MSSVSTTSFLNMWKVIVHEFLNQVSQTISLVIFLHFLPFLTQKFLIVLLCQWIQSGISRSWPSFFIPFTKFKFCLVHSSSLQFNFFESIDSVFKLFCDLHCWFLYCTGRLIGRHESQGLYYMKPCPSISCFATPTTTFA